MLRFFLNEVTTITGSPEMREPVAPAAMLPICITDTAGRAGRRRPIGPLPTGLVEQGPGQSAAAVDGRKPSPMAPTASPTEAKMVTMRSNPVVCSTRAISGRGEAMVTSPPI